MSVMIGLRDGRVVGETVVMSGTRGAAESETNERPLAAYFDSLPREAAERGSFTPDDVAEIICQDRDASTR